LVKITCCNQAHHFRAYSLAKKARRLRSSFMDHLDPEKQRSHYFWLMVEDLGNYRRSRRA
jgi:hypothetical protein